MSKKTVEIFDDECWVAILPYYISWWFLKSYTQQGFVYIENNKPTYCSDTLRWLDEIKVITTSQKRADKLMFEYLNKIYPQYSKYIQLY